MMEIMQHDICPRNIVAESRASTGLQSPGLVGVVTQSIDYVKGSRTEL